MSHDQTDFRMIFLRLNEANRLRHDSNFRVALELYIDVASRYLSAELCAVIAACYYQQGFQNAQETGQSFLEALVWLSKAISLQPQESQFYTLLGEVYSLGLLDYQKARDAYQKAAEINSCDVEARRGASSLYGVPEKVVTLDEAIKWMEEVVHLQPDIPSHHQRLAELYYEAGRKNDAEEAWLHALLCTNVLDPELADSIQKWL